MSVNVTSSSSSLSTADCTTPSSSSSSSRSSTKGPEEGEEAGEIWLSDILDPSEVVFVDEPINRDFAELLAPRKFPLKTPLEISKSTSPHANNARNALFRDTHYYQLLAAIIVDALEGDGLSPPERCATSEESIRRDYCGFDCEPVYQEDDEEEEKQ